MLYLTNKHVFEKFRGGEIARFPPSGCSPSDHPKTI